MEKRINTFPAFAGAAMSCALGLGLFAASIAPTLADPPQKPAPASQTSTSASDGAQFGKEYVIGVDDVIGVAAVGHEDLLDTYTVVSDGTITVKGIPTQIHALGMTIDELQKVIYKGLDKLYNNLNLSVYLKESHSKYATILGAKSSGQYALRPNERVSELIAQAGGPPIVRLKYCVANLIRGNQLIKLNIPKIAGKDPDPDSNPLLQPRDTVVIDTLEEAPPPSFNVIGQVAKQGTYSLPLDNTPVTLVQAIAEAGGEIDKADLNKVALIRDGQRTPLALYPLLVLGKTDGPEAKITMKDGDTLLFPVTQAKYLVVGMANKPGTFPLTETVKVSCLQALADAGGQMQGGDQRKAGILRTVNGKPTFIKINFDDMVKHPDKHPITPDLYMQDNDTLYIPQHGKSLNINDVISPFFILTGLGFHPFN